VRKLGELRARQIQLTGRGFCFWKLKRWSFVAPACSFECTHSLVSCSDFWVPAAPRAGARFTRGSRRATVAVEPGLRSARRLRVFRCRRRAWCSRPPHRSSPALACPKPDLYPRHAQMLPGRAWRVCQLPDTSVEKKRPRAARGEAKRVYMGRCRRLHIRRDRRRCDSLSPVLRRVDRRSSLVRMVGWPATSQLTQ